MVVGRPFRFGMDRERLLACGDERAQEVPIPDPWRAGQPGAHWPIASETAWIGKRRILGVWRTGADVGEGWQDGAKAASGRSGFCSCLAVAGLLVLAVLARPVCSCWSCLLGGRPARLVTAGAVTAGARGPCDCQLCPPWPRPGPETESGISVGWHVAGAIRASGLLRGLPPAEDKIFWWDELPAVALWVLVHARVGTFAAAAVPARWAARYRYLPCLPPSPPELRSFGRLAPRNEKGACPRASRYLHSGGSEAETPGTHDGAGGRHSGRQWLLLTA